MPASAHKMETRSMGQHGVRQPSPSAKMICQTGASRARSLLVHVIDGTSRDPIGDYQAIQQELQLFDSELAAKPQLVAYNKMDVPDSSDYWDSVQDFLLTQVCLSGSVRVNTRLG